MTINSSTNAYSSYSSSGVSSSSRKEPNFEDMAQQLISALDTNSDGSIDKAEFSAAAQALASNSSSSANSSASSTKAADVFSKLDTNSDGSMSSAELIAALKDMKPPEHPQGKGGGGGMPPPPPPSDASSSSDSSSTSSLSKIFSTLDTNKDGTISADELMALFSDSKETSSSATSASSTSASEADTIAKQLSQNLLKQILASYGSNGSSDSNSALSLSA